MTSEAGPSRTLDFRTDPSSYRAVRTEQGVFTSPPYSGEIKSVWRFVDSKAASESAKAIWSKFLSYKEEGDFVGMDISRKFLQMGRTRSLRYALRRGGRKYKEEPPHKAGSGPSTRAAKTEIPRTGEIYDREKSKGAAIFEQYLKRCWDDQTYSQAFERWKQQHNRKAHAGTGGHQS